jgi:hypothetical protein
VPAIYQYATPPAPAPWSAWTFWQHDVTVDYDNDMFNGSAAHLSAWISSFQPKLGDEVQ